MVEGVRLQGLAGCGVLEYNVLRTAIARDWERAPPAAAPPSTLQIAQTGNEIRYGLEFRRSAITLTSTRAAALVRTRWASNVSS